MHASLATFLLLGLNLLAVQLPASDPAEAAWAAAMALKQRSSHEEAAASFAKFKVDFPGSPRAVACTVEEGVCWFAAGRAVQVFHQTTAAAQERFDRALGLFRSVASEHAQAPEAPRAFYMQGSTHLFSGELQAAELDYSTVIEKYAADRTYFGKALDQRALVRRHLLLVQPAILDLRRWIKEVAEPPAMLAKMNGQLARALMLDRPAPAYQGDVWFNGDPVPLESQAGNLLALYFFATWCTNCEAELPYLQELERRYGPQGLRVLGVVNREKEQTPEIVRAYLAEKHISFSVLQDGGATSQKYRVGTIPMLALIDRRGVLRWCDNPSVLPKATLERLVNEGSSLGDKGGAK